MALGFAAVCFIVGVAMFFVVRGMALTDRQIALASVVALVSVGFGAVSLFSAGSAAGAAYARQRIALHLLQKEKEYVELRRRQAELDASEEAARNCQNAVAWSIAAQAVAACTAQNQANRSLEELSAFMTVYSAHCAGEVDLLSDRQTLELAGGKVLQRYEGNGGGATATQQPSYARIKTVFHLEPA